MSKQDLDDTALPPGCKIVEAHGRVDLSAQ